MKKLLIILAIPAVLFLGCKPKPTPSPNNVPQPKACFTISKALIDSGETVTTTNCSTHASTYAWNFGLGLQSSSTATAPSFTYKNPARGTSYLVKLIAYGEGTTSNEKDTNVTLGYRRIDSVVIKNIPGFAPVSTTKIALQFGPDANISEFNSPQITPTGFPFTFNMTGLSPKIYINSKTQTAWKGRFIDVSNPNGVPIYTFGTGVPVYFSLGLNASPIKVTDNAMFEMDVYYSIQPTDK